jgi:c(7)-type cytochrome triheme protein
VGTPKPIQQPIAFSHKKHCDAGMECPACHKLRQKGDIEGIPSAGDCMVCHQAIKAESPDIKTVAEFEKDGKRIPWVRIYILPDFVVFSHKQHLDANVKCEECHGQVTSREVLEKEQDFTMKTCMACHRARKARTTCDLCHKLSM